MPASSNPDASIQPYLLRAWHEWCGDQGYTPYIVVSVDEHVQVPSEFVRDGEIVLNVSVEATHALVLGNDAVRFSARFGGRARDVVVPCDRVRAIYARETGQGMAFAAAPVSHATAPSAGVQSEAAVPTASPGLSVVASATGPVDAASAVAPLASTAARPTLKRVK